MGLLDKTFQLRARGTSVQTEVLAGATTFLTMAYIVLVNPAILSTTGMPLAGVAAATCLAAGVGCLLMGFLANYPIALAPGMGLNAYFAFTVVGAMGIPWQTALGLVFISGVLFFVLTLVGVRQLIVSAIPRALFSAIAAGIGLFIAFIGLRGAGLVVANPATLVALGDIHSSTVLLALLGLAILSILLVLKVRGAIFIGIVATAILGWVLGLASWNPQPYSLEQMTGTALKLDIPAALGIGGHGFGLALLEILFVFLFVDLFDNVGTLVAVSKKAGLMQPDGSIPRLNRILFADAGATVVGSLAGTSTVVSYIESASGVSAGGRTGLTAVVTGLLFLATLFVAPWAQVIPAAATAPALILVGAMMMGPLTEIDWDDPVVSIPAFLTLITIPLTFSIANGLAFGVIAYAVLKLASRRVAKADWLLFALAALFMARFVYMAFEA
ncbi:MAG: NCS2 family permease [Alphaproteobacteria bacterium]|nr:NCS2 family permease [Alphaproteobacteria bacterium]MBU1515256.1 NCS2 family permease [Alphaproteobacteria bacterium]MBU2092386.1 NCS2 family permease [Alphaproteobacteria bacterium]MBU2152980.1 NCS2 family permease [Alphaproteobacteria bacterium]MBU2305811.1 NCS2 family permease [Alphaproteobacteria bacterium]